MPEPLALFNGEFIPAAALAVPAYDLGFMQGVTVSEQLRTFQGNLFRLEQHLERLGNSLSIVGLENEVSLSNLAAWATELVTRNHALLETGDDLGLSIFVTPGFNPAMVTAVADGATAMSFGLSSSIWSRPKRSARSFA